MKVLIVGNGKVGSSISTALVREKHDVTVVDIDPDSFRKSQRMLDLMCIEGNGAAMDTLKEASVDEAGLLIAATPYDELNILCCLIGRRLGAKRTISRVRTPEYFGEMHLIRNELGLSMVINPESAAADEIMRLLVYPSASKVEVFEKGRLCLVEYKVQAGTIFDGQTLSQLYKKVKSRFLICVVQRGDDVYIPSGNFMLKAGDRIHFAATNRNTEKFFSEGRLDKEKIKKVMVVGGGSVCYYLSKRMIKAGMKVKIVEQNKERCLKLAEDIPECTVICGDGTDPDLLIEEGLENCDAFVALTGIDEENILISAYAKEMANAKTITKITRENYHVMADNMGLNSIINPKSLTTENVLSYVRSLENAGDSEFESLYNLVGNTVEAVEVKVRDNITGLTGIQIKDVKLKPDILICAIIRARQIIIPDGSSIIQKEDAVVIVSKDRRLSKITDILRES